MLFAQSNLFEEVSYRRISTAEGLPSDLVYSLQEDEQGWIWAGTEAGLYRYDGVSFIPYQSALARQADIHDVKLGPNGRIFAQNFRGQLFCVSEDSLKLVGDFEGMHSQFISYGFLGEDLVIATQHEVRSYPSNQDAWPLNGTSTFDTLKVAESPELHSVPKLGGLIAREGGNGPTAFGGIKSGFQAPEKFHLLSARPQGDSTWLVHTGDGEKRNQTDIQYINARGKPHKIGLLNLPNSFINRGKLYVQGLPNGNILIGGIRGLLLVENPTSTIPKFTNLLPGSTVYDLKIDKTGNLWIATSTQGLLLIPDLNVRQQDFPLVHAPIVGIIAPEQGKFLYGLTFNGSLYQLYPKFEQLATDGWHTRFWQSDINDYYVSHVKIHPSPPKDLSQALLQQLSSVKESALLPDGTIAMATAVRALLIKPYRDPQPVLKSELFPDQNLHLIGVLDQENAQKTGKKPKETKRKGSELRKRRSTGISFDQKRGKLYVAFNDRLTSYPLGTGPATTIADSLIGGRAQIIKNIEDELYIGLAGTGLTILNLNTNTSVQLLPNLAIERIHHAGNKVWLETNQGIYRAILSDESFLFQPVDTRHGLPPGKPTAFFADKDFAYAVYDRRVVRITSDQTPAKPTGYTVALAKTERAGIALANPNQKTIEVIANEQTLRLQPRIPDYSESPTTSFEFKLEPSDKIWQTLGGDNPTISLNVIAEGTHQLNVRLAGQPETQSSYRIEARVPFWRKPWPYVIGITALASFMLFLIRRRLKKQQLEAERQTALRESQLAALAAQMNPHFVFNALNSVQDFIMRNDRLAANDYLTKFARLIRLTLEHSRSADITLADELDMMRTYLELEGVRFDNEIKIDFSYSDHLNLSVKLPALVVQPYVENAFKHGLMHRLNNRQLRVAYEMSSTNTLRVTVEDNGVGRARALALSEANRIGRKFATGATAKRLVLLNATHPDSCSVHTEDLIYDGVVTGTRVTIKLRVTTEEVDANKTKTKGYENA